MKKILLVALVLLNVSCINLNFFKKDSLNKLSEKKRETKIEEMYNNLDKQYYKLLEDEIKENDRTKLENDFINLKNQILKPNKNNVSAKHLIFLNDYSKKITLKLQYLEDLK